MKYHKSSKVTELRGNVRLRMKDSYVRADEITLDEERKSLTASGRVVIEDQQDRITGTMLYYDYDKEYFELANPQGRTTAKDVQGTIYYNGERAWGSRRKLRIFKGEFTTCDPTCRQEYHVTAKNIAIYPDIKIISRKAVFFMGSQRVWYMPIHVISLKKKQEHYQPDIGYNKEEGFYVKTKYPYMVTEAVTGLALFDYISRKGIGYGAEHDYNSRFFGGGNRDFGKGHNYFKTMNENDTGQVSTTVRQTQAFRIGEKVLGSISYNRDSSYNIYRDRSRQLNL